MKSRPLRWFVIAVAQALVARERQVPKYDLVSFIQRTGAVVHYHTSAGRAQRNEGGSMSIMFAAPG